MITYQGQNKLPLMTRQLFLAGLSLFGVSIAVSKSASNVLIGLVYIGAAILVLAHRPFRQQLIRSLSQPLFAPLALYLTVAVVGLANTENIHDGIGIVSKMSGLVLIYIMVSVLLDMFGDREREHHTAERLLVALLIGITALDLVALMTYLGLVGHRKLFLPLWPLNVHHIWFSNLNAVGIYTAAGFLLFRSGKLEPRDRAFLFAFLGTAALCVLLSLSRTAWTGLLVTTVALVSLSVRSKKTVFFLLVGLAAGAILSYFLSSIVKTRLDLIVSEISSFLQGGNTNTNIGARFLLWKASYGMFLSNHLMGAGTGDFVLLLQAEINSGRLPVFLKEFNQPHNIYLFAMATNGVLGLAALLYLFYRILKLALPFKDLDADTRLFAFLAAATAVHYMAAGMTDSFFNIQMLRYAFGFVMGVCVRRSLFGRK